MSALPLAVAGRSPWQRIYAAAHRLRRRRSAARARRLPRPVVSIGNLHWGGSGKTPLTAALARHLVSQGLRPAILSRGYGRKDRQVRVVSTGDGPLLGPAVAGDEPVLLAGEARGAAVVVAPRRYDAGRHALERLDPPPELFLLDDGFSHLDLWRDLDLLVFPRSDPFGGGRLWPGGRLREPLASAAHADAAILTGVGVEDPAGDALAEALRPHGFDGPGFVARFEIGAARTVDGRAVPQHGRIFAVSAIGRPAEFERAVEKSGFELVGALSLPDHHAYPDPTLREIESGFAQSGAEWVLTTSKDRVKLLGRLDLPLAELPLEAEPEPALLEWLDGRLEELLGSAADGRESPDEGGGR